ncbi:hypothetical protein M0802_013699 [Mischocyttarus mexicanus]|nr:hypothetical protein M0802_013699 [Mischocyttarus mexicanus]
MVRLTTRSFLIPIEDVHLPVMSRSLMLVALVASIARYVPFRGVKGPLTVGFHTSKGNTCNPRTEIRIRRRSEGEVKEEEGGGLEGLGALDDDDDDDDNDNNFNYFRKKTI